MDENPYKPPGQEPIGPKKHARRSVFGAIMLVLFRYCCSMSILLGIVGVPFGAFMGAESGHDGPPIPIEEAARRKTLGKTIMFTSGATGITAAFALYWIDRRNARRT